MSGDALLEARDVTVPSAACPPSMPSARASSPASWSHHVPNGAGRRPSSTRVRAYARRPRAICRARPAAHRARRTASPTRPRAYVPTPRVLRPLSAPRPSARPAFAGRGRTRRRCCTTPQAPVAVASTRTLRRRRSLTPSQQRCSRSAWRWRRGRKVSADSSPPLTEHELETLAPSSGLRDESPDRDLDRHALRTLLAHSTRDRAPPAQVSRPAPAGRSRPAGRRRLPRRRDGGRHDGVERHGAACRLQRTSRRGCGRLRRLPGRASSRASEPGLTVVVVPTCRQES